MRAAIFHNNSLQARQIFKTLYTKQEIEFCYLENIFNNNERHEILRQFFIRN